MEKITILMSTYNGEKYIKQQLDSIMQQKDVDLHLCIRDDGSNDNTLNIIHQFENKYKGRIDIIEGNNIGWKKSFFELIHYASIHYPKCNFFAFADQDDIWLPEKLISGIKMLDRIGKGANLYCSNQYRFKNGINMGKVWDEIPDKSPIKSLLRNCATGCTIIMNRCLIEILDKSQISISLPHDYWAFLSAIFCGKVVLDADAYILYRQHENNQIGSKKGFINLWKRRLKSISHSLKSHEREVIAKELLRCYDNYISPELKQQLFKISTYRNCLKNKLNLCFDKDFKFNSNSNNFWLILRIFLGVL